MDKHFKELFAGNQERFLTYDPHSTSKRDDGKTKVNYRTVNQPVDDDDWAAHRSGKRPLGLSPLRNGMVKWGAVDVDYYRDDGPFFQSEEEVTAFLKAWGDPCLIANTKSRGIHIIAFTNDWVPADRMRRYLEAKRDAVLEGDLLKASKEVFPKQSDGDGSQMNLPAFGDTRSVVGWSYPGVLVPGTGDNPADWAEIASRCHVSEGTMADVIMNALAPAKSEPKRARREPRKYAGGFKRPSDGYGKQGRNNYLYCCGASARARGADDDEVEQIIRMVNDEFENPDSEFAHKGPIKENARIEKVIEQVQKLEQAPVRDLSYDAVTEMNELWAIMKVEGKVEFLDRLSGHVYPKGDWLTVTAPMQYTGSDGRPKSKAQAWLHDPDRLEFDGIVIEAPDYDGPAFNLFEGWAVQPRDGDVLLWIDYVENIVCGGDKELAHWVMTYIADGVQRPWSTHPGTALALRGGQGGGKSFLGRMLSKIMKPAQVEEVADSDRLFDRFNRDTFGTTFILAEESIFTGSPKQAATLKAFITARTWKYERKHLASFYGKNVHRVIATTNDEQAVHLDRDDRRWTIVEVATRFENPDSGEAVAFWAPYYEIEPGAVLAYLLQYEVDLDLIKRPHITQAKREDKIASDPVMEVLHEIAEAGVVPDDVDARGAISNATLLRECRARGASPYEKPVTLANRARKMVGTGAAVRHAAHIKEYQRTTDGDGFPTMHPILDKQVKGTDLGSLPDFRATMAKLTGSTYPDGEHWKAFVPAQADWSPGDPEDVERAFADQQRQKFGGEPPF